MGLTAITLREGEPRVRIDDGEELRYVQPQMAIVLGNESPEQPGKLYVTTRRLLWLSDTEHHKGYGVDFLSISLHAVSRDPEAYPLPCIYTQIESRETDRDEEPDSGDNEDLDLSQVTEMRLVPSDSSIYPLACNCRHLICRQLYGHSTGYVAKQT